MINFKISAPGRIFLSGEHLVTYGKRFVLAGLNLRTKVEFCELPMSDNIIKIDFARVNLQRDIFFNVVTWNFPYVNVAVIQSDPVNYIKYVKHIIDMNYMWETSEQRFSLQIFFYLLSTINLEKKPFRLSVSTEIPSGPGLGSSTSFAVCLAACFLHWKRLQNGHHTEFNDQELEKIRRHVKFCEEIMQHDAFASLDAKVCVEGRIKNCIRHDYKNYSTMTINSRTELRLLLINTNIRQNKEERTQQIADLSNSRIDFDLIINTVEEIAISMFAKIFYINSIANNNDPYIREEAYNALEKDIRKNQTLLRDYYLSHEEFDRICSIGFEYGMTGKLTGFRGGYVYFLIPPRMTGEEIKRIETYCLEQQIDYKFANVDYDGVKIDE